MRNMGILDQPERPLWPVRPVSETLWNPLDGRWAPNEATPSYVASYEIDQFLAYGFIFSYMNLHPDYFAGWNMVEEYDLVYLRHYFLNAVEDTLLAIYEGKLEASKELVDCGSDEALVIGDADDDGDEFHMQWKPVRIREDAIAFDLEFTSFESGREMVVEPDTIWLATEAYQDRRKVLMSLLHARSVNLGRLKVPGVEVHHAGTLARWAVLKIKPGGQRRGTARNGRNQQVSTHGK